MPGSLPYLQLPIGEYQMAFACEGLSDTQAFLGSAWRGAFGHALRRTVCLTELTDCRKCSLIADCSYPYIFETPPPAAMRKMRRYTAAPHPFVLALPWFGIERECDGSAMLRFMLFGNANALLPHVVLALRMAGATGVGPGRSAWRLTGVKQCDEHRSWSPILMPGGGLTPHPPFIPTTPPVPDRVHLQTLTPLRLKRQGRYVRPDEFRFTGFFGALLRRISMLMYFHTATPLETDFRALADSAMAVETQVAKLEWRETVRTSQRQRTRMKMGGVFGIFELSGQELAPFWGFLWFGRWTMSGHAASMGLGQYVLSTSQACENEMNAARRV